MGQGCNGEQSPNSGAVSAATQEHSVAPGSPSLMCPLVHLLADEAGPQAAALQTHLSHTALAWVVKTQTSAGVCGTNSILLPTHPVVSTPGEQVFSASSIQKLAPY